MMELREDLRTRLGWDLVFRLEPLSDSDKQAALADYAKRKGLPLTAELIAWMLTHYARDIRQLFALVDALDRYSLSKHRAVTVPLLRAMLADREFLQS
jgi:DnaA family protein